MNKTILTPFKVLCLLTTLSLLGGSFDVEPVRGESNDTIKAVILDSWGADYSAYTIYPWLNSNWLRYGSIPIVIDYTSLNKEEISYSDLTLTEADVVIISHAYPRPEHVFTDIEVAAIKRYVEEGHGIIGTYGTLVPENNRKLAELFGMNQSISYILYPSGGVSTGIFNILCMTCPLFASLPNPFSVPTVSETIYVPSHDWTAEGVTDGSIVALTSDNEAAIITRTTTCRSIYFTNQMEEKEGPTEISEQVFYNAIIWAGAKPWMRARDDLQEQITLLNSTFQKLIDGLQEQSDLVNSTLQISANELQGQIDSLNSTLTSRQEAIINEFRTVRNIMYLFTATTIVFLAIIVYLAMRKPKIKP